MPPGWVSVATFGTLNNDENVQTEVAAISPKIVMAERASYRRSGNAWCRQSASAKILVRPAAAAPIDVMAFLAARRAAQLLMENGICHVAVRSGPDRWTFRSFDERGYRLPILDQDPLVFTIVPRARFPEAAGRP